jgi:cation diffusion facilitator family transporter
MLHYKTDLFSNAWILLWLIVIEFTWFYYIDAIIWIIVAIYISVVAWDLVKNWFLLLLDVSLSKEEVGKIKEILKKEKDITDYHCLKTRQSGNTKFVEIHLVFDDKISLLKAHDISDKVEERIRKIDDVFAREVLIHMDPYDDK